jgi:hypothetical protein
VSEWTSLMPRAEFTEAEAQRLMERLWRLLGELAGKYTGGQSTSVSVETAREMMRSIWYTLDTATAQAGRPLRSLLTGELWPQLEQGRTLLRRKTERAAKYYEAVCRSDSGIRNVFYDETVEGLGKYLRGYDVRYFAHRPPADIDYPLIVTPPETLPGISYAEAYLAQLLAENLLLRRFDRQSVIRLLGAQVPDVREYRLNLAEQPLTNALALFLLEKPADPASLTAKDRQCLLCLLQGKTPAQTKDVLRQAAEGLLAGWEQTDPLSRKTMEALTDDLLPRLLAALKCGCLSDVFPSPVPQI